MTTTIKVRLFGSLKKLAGHEEIFFNFNPQMKVKNIIHELSNSLPKEFNEKLIDPELGDPRPHAIILLNEIEINVLEGINTQIRDGDTLTILPVVHGG